jgi:uncharacterized protein
VPLELLTANLAQPALAFFGLGVLATRVRSDLDVPEQVAKALSLYLLIAIGFKGGVQLRAEGMTGALAAGAGAGLLLAVALPFLAYLLLRAVVRAERIDAASIAAHYGSVSVVTFIAATTFLGALGVSSEGFMVTLLALMEAPAIIIGLALARGRGAGGMRATLRHALTSGSVMLLVGGLAVGFISGQQGMAELEGFLVTPFRGVLAIFLLNMGLVAARHLDGFRTLGWRVLAFGIAMPLIGIGAGVVLGSAVGLSVGGATLLGVLGGSASYIAAPAAMREALPEANPSLSLGLALGITFPFNLVAGIPLAYLLAAALG